jgi:hypothetical protein
MTAASPKDRFPTASSAVIALGEVFGIVLEQQRTSVHSAALSRPSSPARVSQPSAAPRPPAVARSADAESAPDSGSSIPTTPILDMDLLSTVGDRKNAPVEVNPAPTPPEASRSSEPLTGAGVMTRTTPIKRSRSPILLGAAAAVALVVGAFSGIRLLTTDPTPVTQSAVAAEGATAEAAPSLAQPAASAQAAAPEAATTPSAAPEAPRVIDLEDVDAPPAAISSAPQAPGPQGTPRSLAQPSPTASAYAGPAKTVAQGPSTVTRPPGAAAPPKPPPGKGEAPSTAATPSKPPVYTRD